MTIKLDKQVPSLTNKKTQISVLQGYCEVGRYLTLFDIGHGGAGTDLDARRWYERRMFSKSYDGCDAQRPRYGNVNLMAHVKGDEKARRYGKSYLILKDHVRRRCTVTSCDSSRAEAVLGTLEHAAHVLSHSVDLCRHESEDRREKFLRQLHELVNWDGTKDFAKVKVHLKR